MKILRAQSCFLYKLLTLPYCNYIQFFYAIDNKITTSIQNDGKAFSSSTQLLNDSIINIGIESTTTPSKHSKNDGAFTNSLDNMGDSPVKSTTKLRNQQMLTQKKVGKTCYNKYCNNFFSILFAAIYHIIRA